jgi:hypothetical protein
MLFSKYYRLKPTRKYKIKQRALDHYDRMIAWAEKRNPHSILEIPSFHADVIMKAEIGETWDAGSCPYCIEFAGSQRKRRLNQKKTGSSCGKCPLLSNREWGSRCCNGLWIEMFHSPNWSLWIKYAKRVREYIDIHGDIK